MGGGENMFVDAIDELHYKSDGLVESATSMNALVSSQQLTEITSSLNAIKATLDSTIESVKVNANSVVVLHSLCNVMFTKLENIENLLKQPTQVAATKANITPNNKGSTSSAKAYPRKDVVTPQYNRSMSIPGINVNKIEVVDLSRDDDEHGPSGIKKNENRAMIGRRLPFTSSPTGLPFKIPKSEPTAEGMGIRKGPNEHFTPTNNMGGISFKKPTVVGSGAEKLSDQLLSKFVKTNFPPKPEMELSPERVHVSAYVFHPDMDPSEVLLKMDYWFCTRKHFQSLCPDKTIDTKIVHMVAFKATLLQRKIASQTIWSLPPLFAREASNEEPVHDLIDEYAKEWMPPFENLKHIYLPIQDSGGHWFLMVASIQHQMLYYMDPYFEEQNVPHRQGRIKDLWDVIIRCIRSHYFPGKTILDSVDLDNYEVSDPIGPVSKTYCQHSALYVIEWMSMEYAFQPNIHPMGDEDVFRMRLAMDLLFCEDNVNKEMMLRNAEHAWQTRKYA